MSPRPNPTVNTEHHIHRTLPRFSVENVFIEELRREVTCLVEWAGMDGTVRMILWNGGDDTVGEIVNLLNEATK